MESRKTLTMDNDGNIYVEERYFRKQTTINAIIYFKHKDEQLKKVFDALKVIELKYKDKIEINIRIKKTDGSDMFVLFHNRIIYKNLCKLDSYIYIVKKILNKKAINKEKLNMYKEKYFFDLSQEARETITNVLNNIVYDYKLNEVCEIILFQFLKQFYTEQYSELDYTFLINKIVLSSSSIKRNLTTLIKKGILTTTNNKIYRLSEEILKDYDDLAAQKQFYENKNIKIIDMNTNKEVSIKECVDIMIKNSDVN